MSYALRRQSLFELDIVNPPAKSTPAFGVNIQLPHSALSMSTHTSNWRLYARPRYNIPSLCTACSPLTKCACCKLQKRVHTLSYGLGDHVQTFTHPTNQLLSVWSSTYFGADTCMTISIKIIFSGRDDYHTGMPATFSYMIPQLHNTSNNCKQNRLDDRNY